MREASIQSDGLVRHPRPYPTESLFGYILRLSEENGYRTPYVLLRMIGRERFRDPRLPLRELARIAHREVSELEGIAYSDMDDERRRFRLIGRPLPAFELRLKQPSLCPECVRSAGFIEAHWDLSLMTGCPVRRSHLLSRCPECHLQLRWLRPGQLECNCGAIFGHAAGEILSDSEVELLNVIRCKMLALSVPTASSTGIPAAQLSALSLSSLLSLIRTLAKFHLQLNTVNDCHDPKRLVRAAAHVLSSYPVNLHKLLWSVGTQHGHKRSGGIVRSQFKIIYKGIFRRSPRDAPQSRDFLGSAFLDFAMNQRGSGVLDAKLLRRIQKTMPKRIVTLNEFGELYGLGRKKARRVLAMKNIATTRICVGQRDRVVIDLRKLNEPPTPTGNILSLPYAAAAIGVSAKGLRKLRASGDFEVKHNFRRNGYHERDSKLFIERLLALNPSARNKSLPPDCITLYQAMRRYHGTGEGGSSIIRALLSGELRVMGNVDGTVRGLFVSQAEFQQIGKNERARQKGNARMPSEVAEEIHCPKKYVPVLVGRGLLNGWNTPTGLRVSEASIARFKKKYVSLASLAREIGTRASFLMKHCAAEHIPMVVVPSNLSRHAFVRLKDRSAVLSFRPVRWWNQQAAQQKQRRTATEQDRPKLLHEVQQGHITEKQAAVELGFSVPWVHQMLVRMRAGEDSGKIFNLPTAAEAIGIAAKALSKLRASGDFEVKYHIGRNGYHERDIKQFIERLLALSPSATNKSLPPDCITLYQAVRRYNGSGASGASIIRALLSGELRVMGNIDGTVRGLFVSRTDYQQFCRNDRARQNGNARTALEVDGIPSVVAG